MFKLFQFSVLLASFLLIASSVSALETSVKSAVTSMEAPSSYMLVGNSYTYYSGGLNGVINGLIEAAGIKVKRDRMVTIGGAGLGWFNVYVDHSDGGKIKNFDFTKEKVFDAVILQDNSRGFIQPQRQQVLKIYVKQHAYDLRCFGIQPLIMMTWARKNKPEMTAQLAEATTKVANEANAMVVPVGLAFAEAIKADSSVELHRTDTTHPSPEGTYLAACVTFATMFHRSPVGLKYYGIEKVDPKTAEFLQKVAWHTVCEFFGWQK